LKYTTDESLEIVLQRRRQILARRDRQVRRSLGGAVGVLSAALVLLICLMPGGADTAASRSVYGAFLLSREAGGYVLVSVIAFVLGAAVTLFCLHRRRSGTTRSPGSKKNDMEDAL